MLLLLPLLGCSSPTPPPPDPAELDAVPADCLPSSGLARSRQGGEPAVQIVLRGGLGPARGLRIHADGRREVLGSTWLRARPFPDPEALAETIEGAGIPHWVSYDVLEPSLDEGRISLLYTQGSQAWERSFPTQCRTARLATLEQALSALLPAKASLWGSPEELAPPPAPRQRPQRAGNEQVDR